MLHFIKNGLSRLFSKRDDKDAAELRKLPFRELYNIVRNKKELNGWNKLAAMIDYTYPAKEKRIVHNADKIMSELNSWNKLAAMIDYTYPAKEKLVIYNADKTMSQKQAQIMKEIKYCVKYASYVYFMPIIGNPSDIIIKKEDKHLPFLGLKSFGICKAGYFIGIDHDKKNKYILMCIRGTETIGDTLTDLDAHCSLENFGEEDDDDKMFNVHRGIFRAAKVMENKVTDKIKQYLTEYPDYKILVTGHSLGAGLCSLLGLLWKTKGTFKNDEFSCYSFASPLVIDYDGMKESLKGNNMISVAVTTDIVTRLSVEGLIKLNERIKIIQSYNNYEDIISKIIEARCSSDEYKEFYNKLSEDERKMINELKMENCGDIRDELLLYPCGELLWFIPEFLENDNISTKDKYSRLINLINWQCESSKFTQTIQFIYKICCDFYVFDKNEILTSIQSISQPVMCKPKMINKSPIESVDRFEFTQLVSYGIESLQAHLPGRYSTGFNVDVYDIVKMSKYYETLKSLSIRKSMPNIMVKITIILICILKIALEIISYIISFLFLG